MVAGVRELWHAGGAVRQGRRGRTTGDDVTEVKIADTIFWQLDVCNACRYCEGYCAVFPALEKRRRFTPGDVVYLANLCHDCRACYYACMYAPPHEFGVNIPQALAEVREQTYAQYALPRVVGDLATRNSKIALVAAGVSLVGFAFVALQNGLSQARTGAWGVHAVIPYVDDAALPLRGGVVIGVMLPKHVFMRDAKSPLITKPAGALLGALGEAFTLRYLRGGNAGRRY
jgi:citrate/tricarballylate utilization protein